MESHNRDLRKTRGFVNRKEERDYEKRILKQKRKILKKQRRK